jgi:hypothetical protein
MSSGKYKLKYNKSLSNVIKEIYLHLKAFDV